MNGIAHIQQAFGGARCQNRSALIFYYPAGYPDAPTSLAVLQKLAENGADLLEIGMPFSDPLADGPTIQYATQTALAGGMTTTGCLNLVAELRQRGVAQPLVLMGYLNPILAYGPDRWVKDAAAAGADGVILPDLPPEEGAFFESCCEAHGMALIYLLSPATPPQRAGIIAARTRGFLYLVSLTGVTGARQRLPEGLEDLIRRTRSLTQTPLAVGFGIATPQQARLVARNADGVIIGSALIDAVRNAADRPGAAGQFAQILRAAVEEVEAQVSAAG